MDVSRRLLDSTEHIVRVRYPFGRFSMRSTSDPVIFAMHLRYDEDRMQPLHTYDAVAHRAILGFDGDRGKWRNSRHNDQSEMQLTLSDAVAFDLGLELGATEARVDVGGLAINRLRVETGAADATLDFSAPNKAKMRRLDIQMGAAGFTIRNLGNANVSAIRVEGGVGKVDLDFGGGIREDVTVDATVAIGHLRLRLPRDVGVRVELRRVLGSFDHPGLRKRGDAWFSDNWDSATVRMRVRAETVFGAVEIERVP